MYCQIPRPESVSYRSFSKQLLFLFRFIVSMRILSDNCLLSAPLRVSSFI